MTTMVNREEEIDLGPVGEGPVEDIVNARTVIRWLLDSGQLSTGAADQLTAADKRLIRATVKLKRLGVK